MLEKGKGFKDNNVYTRPMSDKLYSVFTRMTLLHLITIEILINYYSDLYFEN